MPSTKMIFTISLLLCCLNVDVESTKIRGKRDNEAVLFGNQQSSPHQSIKKAGPNALESHMKSEYKQYEPQEQDERDEVRNNIDHGEKFLNRAKRTLIKRSMENGMAPRRMLHRKKRYVDELDPVTLEKLKNLLQNTYDSYYSDSPSTEDNNVEYEEEEPYVIQDKLYDTPPQMVQKRQRVEKNTNSDNAAFEIVEVDGVPGLFFPLSNVIKEKGEEDRRKRSQYRRMRENYLQKRYQYQKRREDLDEDRYNSKLEKLAEMLAKNSQ